MSSSSFFHSSFYSRVSLLHSMLISGAQRENLFLPRFPRSANKKRVSYLKPKTIPYTDRCAAHTLCEICQLTKIRLTFFVLKTACHVYPIYAIAIGFLALLRNIRFYRSCKVVKKNSWCQKIFVIILPFGIESHCAIMLVSFGKKSMQANNKENVHRK